MNILFTAIIFGGFIQLIHASYQYYYPQPLITHHYQQVAPIPQFYIQPNYNFQQLPQEIKNVQLPQIVKTISHTEHDNFLGYGYRTEHNNGHSNVLFLTSGDISQFEPRNRNNLTSIAKNKASNSIDSNAGEINFPLDSNDTDDDILSFLKKPETSFYAFYNVEDKVVAKDSYQPAEIPQARLINNNVVSLFTRFGFGVDDNSNKTEENTTVGSRQGKALDDEKTKENLTQTTTVSSETTTITNEITTMTKMAAGETENPTTTEVASTTTEVASTTIADKIETLS